MRNRILMLENANCVFLLDKEREAYWKDIKDSLDGCSSQKEYNWLLEFKSRDLQIRERKHACYSLFREVLSEYPSLAKNAAYTPKEAFFDFFDEKRIELDMHPK
ncbi:hypothetical protein PTKIN_Ptkin16aG0076200 [Pterospermum kingtungense]